MLEADSLCHSFATDTTLFLHEYIDKKIALYNEAGEMDEDAKHVAWSLVWILHCRSLSMFIVSALQLMKLKHSCLLVNGQPVVTGATSKTKLNPVRTSFMKSNAL